MTELSTIDRKDVNELADRLNMSPGLARDLLILSGNDPELVCLASNESYTLDMVKATIIDARFKKLEM